MKVTIYQINNKRDKHDVKFMGLEFTRKLQKADEIQSSIYDKVYEGYVSARSLEGVYRIFNLEHPEDYRGHSLSVSDIVEIADSPDVEPGFYFSDSIGFQKVDFDPAVTYPFIAPGIDSSKYAGISDLDRIDRKTGLIQLDARLGISLQVTPEELAVLKQEGNDAQDLLVRLVQSDRCVMCGDTYFPDPWNDGVLPGELNFDMPIAPLSPKVPEKKPLDQQIQESQIKTTPDKSPDTKSKSDDLFR